jgi:hypothetical protein
MEIAQLREQRKADLEAHAEEQRAADAKVQAEKDATKELRTETKAELKGLDQMAAMMATFLAGGLTDSALAENKRSHDDSYEKKHESSSQSDEKRRDVRSTPGKKLFTDNMDLEDPALSAQKPDDAPNTPTKQR